MKKVTIAICDTEDTYRERLAEYFIRRKGEQAQIITFSGRRIFAEKSKKSDYDIVLLGTGFERFYPKEETKSLYILLSESPDIGEATQPEIFKYQAAEEIWRCIFSFYTNLGKQNTYVCHQKKEVIGVYSPTQSRMRMPFALTLAQLLASEKKMIYVNLGEWSGFESWFGESYRKDLADLMYLISNNGVKVKGILESVVCTVNRIDYVPPVTDAQLLVQATSEDYRQLLVLLREKTDYETIILDFGVMVPGFFSLLEQCNTIYNVADQGVLAKGQIEQFEKSMWKEGKQELADKMRYVPFSVAETQIMEQEPVLQQWLYGELGDRVRAARYGQYEHA